MGLQQSAHCPPSLPAPCQHGSGSSWKTRDSQVQIITSDSDTVFVTERLGLKEQKRVSRHLIFVILSKLYVFVQRLLHYLRTERY